MKTNTIDNGLKAPSMVAMTWPLFVELILQMLIGNIDTFMVSSYSQNAVGAIGNANQIINIILLTFNVINVATIILVSQYKGANNREKESEIYSLSVFTNLAFGLFISIILLLFSRQMGILLKVPQEMMKDYLNFITSVGGFMFVASVMSTFSAIFRCNGLMKYSMTINIIINILNIIGNFLLIYGIGPFPEMGVVGVAISTVSSRIIGLVIFIISYIKLVGIPISIKKLNPFPKKIFLKIISIGVPSGGESISYDFSQLVILSMVNIMGADVTNTRIYGFMFAGVMCMFTQAIGSAAQILTGFLIGAKRIDEAEKRVWTTTFFSVVISVGIAIIIFIFSDFFFGIFTKNPEVLILGKQIMFFEIFVEFGRAINIVMVRSLQATGDIKFPVTLGIVSNWAVAVVFGFIFGVVLKMGLPGIWLAMACDEVLRGIVFIFRWKSGIWKKNELIAD